jgi:hypothetical protein
MTNESNDQGKLHPPVVQKMSIYRSNDDYMVIVERSSLVYSFMVNTFTSVDDAENGHMIVTCQVGQEVYSMRSDYTRTNFFIKIGEVVGYIMVQVTSRIVRPR